MGRRNISIEKLTYRQHLSRLWAVEIPNWVQDNQIAQAGLIEVQIQAPPNRNFEDFILEIFFSPWMAQSRLPLQRLGNLIHSIDDEQWGTSTKLPLVGDIFRRRLSKWNQISQNDGEKLVLNWLEMSPDELRSQLSIYKLLSNYPADVGRQVLGDQFELLKELDLDLSSVLINERRAKKATEYIRIHLEGLKNLQDKQDAVNQLLDQVSGYLELEFEILQRILHSPEVKVDQELIRRIRGVFAPLQTPSIS